MRAADLFMPSHGTAVSYKRGCRCEACCTANTAQAWKERDRRGRAKQRALCRAAELLRRDLMETPYSPSEDGYFRAIWALALDFEKRAHRLKTDRSDSGAYTEHTQTDSPDVPAEPA